MKVSPFLFLVSVALLPQSGMSSSSEEVDPPSVLHRVETRYSAARTLQVKFMERYLENGRLVRAEAGNAYFLRPGKMRWDYEAPETNTFLVDGKFVWFYSPADRTAIRTPAKESEDWRTPLAFLTSHMKLSRLCARIEVDSAKQGTSSGDPVFRCVLREPSNAERSAARPVLFEVSPGGELKRIVVPEDGGRELEFLFTGWQWNPPLDKTVFEFVPPRGVAIVDGLLPDTPGLRQ